MNQNDNIKKSTLKLTTIAILSSLSIVLSAFESMIPILPIMLPGAKFGLSNIVTMFAAGSMGIVPALIITLIKSLFVGVTRGFTAFLMSFSGGILSTLVMGILIYKFKNSSFGIIGISILGALVHNTAQLTVAIILTSTNVVAYLPFLIITAVVAGSLTGVLLKTILPYLNKLHFI